MKNRKRVRERERKWTRVTRRDEIAVCVDVKVFGEWFSLVKRD